MNQEQFHEYVLLQRQEYFPKTICLVCEIDVSNRKRMYCVLCHAILCTLHKAQDVLKANCQHKFRQYFQSCFGCGTIMMEDIKQHNELTPFNETQDHVCFYDILKKLTKPKNKKYYIGSENFTTIKQVKEVKKAQDLLNLGQPQKKVKIEDQIIEKKYQQQEKQNEQD